jgi:hypothetical protein
MQVYTPGPMGDRGPRYEKYVWVCNNPPRNYQQCDPPEGARVYDALRRSVGQDTFVMRAGCMLGCHPDGTAVAIASNTPMPKANNQTMVFLRGVKTADIKQIIEDYLS